MRTFDEIIGEMKSDLESGLLVGNDGRSMSASETLAYYFGQLRAWREEVYTLVEVAPEAMVCGSCGGKLVKKLGGYRDGKDWDPDYWVRGNWVHDGPMLDRHGAFPVEPWEDD